MTKVYLYVCLILIATAASCSLHEVEDHMNPTTDELDYQLSNELSINTLDASKADFTIDNNNGIINEGDLLELNNSSLNAATYHWDFGNGDVSEEAIPNYAYDRHGEYTVTLSITDKFGNEKIASLDITVLCVFVGNIHTDI